MHLQQFNMSYIMALQILKQIIWFETDTYILFGYLLISFSYIGERKVYSTFAFVYIVDIKIILKEWMECTENMLNIEFRVSLVFSLICLARKDKDGFQFQCLQLQLWFYNVYPQWGRGNKNTLFFNRSYVLQRYHTMHTGSQLSIQFHFHLHCISQVWITDYINQCLLNDPTPVKVISGF